MEPYILLITTTIHNPVSIGYVKMTDLTFDQLTTLRNLEGTYGPDDVYDSDIIDKITYIKPRELIIVSEIFTYSIS